MLEQDADDLNMLAAFLARRGVRSPSEANADVVVVLGNSILASVEVAALTLNILSRDEPHGRGGLVCSGGIGHSTEDLRQSVRQTPSYADIETSGKSEAEIMGAVAVRCGVSSDRILLEDRSTNTGENVLFTRQLLDAKGIHPNCILIVQDPTMQLRAHATFEKVWSNRQEVRLVSFAPFVPIVVIKGDQLRLDNPGVNGLWTFERFVSLVLGEIPRLREYGPSGKGYIAPVDVPPQIEAAHGRVLRSLGSKVAR